MEEILAYIGALKKQIYQALETDKAIKADPYDNVARLKICEKIERFIIKTKGGDEYDCRVNRVGKLYWVKKLKKETGGRQMNNVTLIGRLTKDAGSVGSSIRLSVATNEGYDKEAKKPRVHFVDIYASNVHEDLSPYLKKGMKILIRNAVVSNRRTKDGSYRTFVSVYGGNGNIHLLGLKPKGELERSSVSKKERDAILA
jgi:hypothetical protein